MRETSSQRKLNIIVLYFVPVGTIKYTKWVDGFTSAMSVIEEKHNVLWVNLSDTDLFKLEIKFEDFDVLFVKSNWGARVDRYVRKHKKKISIHKALLISGSKMPDKEGLELYDLLYYETTWYEKFIAQHKNAIHAFGINADIMQPIKTDKTIDWLTVGQFKPYKRMHKIIEKKGNRVAIGELPERWKFWSKENRVYNRLVKAGVTIIGFLDYAELSEYYSKSKNLLISATIDGGGERAVLEARSCGVRNIEIMKDNPKLQSIVDGPIYDHYYYAAQLVKGVNTLV